ncbi:MAG: hypothetical protein ABR598_01625 [Candidatus Dormibacteria bacterium]
MSPSVRRTVARLLGDHKHSWLIAAIFVGSRCVYRVLGVQFDMAPLTTFWQYPDPILLRTDLLRTVFFVHADPPLFDLAVGAALNAPGQAGTWLHALFMAAGLSLGLLVFRLSAELGAPRNVSAILAVGLVISPPAILYETWLYPDYLVTCVLVAGALCLLRFARRRARFWAAGFGLSLCAIVLTRSLFHWTWMVVAIGVLALMHPAVGKRLLAYTAVALLLAVGLYAKNLVTVGHFSSTTCVGASVYIMTTGQLTAAEFNDLRLRRAISAHASVWPFFLSPAEAGLLSTHRTGVPILDQRLKSTGSVNPNHIDFPRTCDQYVQDGLTAFRAYPMTYVRAETQAWTTFFRPPDEYQYFSASNVRAARGPSKVFHRALLQVRDPADRVEPPASIAAVALRLSEVSPILVMSFTAGLALLARRALDRTTEIGVRLVAAFAFLTVAYVMTVGNLLDAGENNRFQFIVDPLLLAVVVPTLYAALQLHPDRRRA